MQKKASLFSACLQNAVDGWQEFVVSIKGEVFDMNKKIRFITETGVLLALLLSLQAVTKPFGQLITGSCVNTVLAVAVLFTGLPGGFVIALISPVAAYLLGIAPQILTVPAIVVGNSVFVVCLHLLCRGKALGQIAGWLTAAVAKFLTLYGIVGGVICGVLSQPLLKSGVLKSPMLTALPATFSWPQLFTALIGGGIALLLTPALRKALHK